MSLKSSLKFPHRTFRRLLWALGVLPCVALAQFTDTFDTIDPAWTTDRYAPAAFQSASFLGDNRLQITIDQTGSALNRPSPTYSASFFNTQGDQRPVGIIGDWSFSANLYVSSAFDTITGQLVRSDLWVQTGTASSEGDYAIMGFSNASPTHPLNAAAPDRAPRFQVFDGTNADPAGWFDAGLPTGFAFDAWHTLGITFTGTNTEYLLDGTIIFTDPSTDGNDLQTAFIEAYNFGQTDSNGLNNYSVYWDNATAVAIPEPANFALMAGLATLGLVWRRRAQLKAP